MVLFLNLRFLYQEFKALVKRSFFFVIWPYKLTCLHFSQIYNLFLMFSNRRTILHIWHLRGLWRLLANKNYIVAIVTSLPRDYSNTRRKRPVIWKEIPVVLTSLPSANLVEASFLFCKWWTFLASIQWHENDGTSSLTNTYTACRLAGTPIWPFAYLTISLPYGDKACVVELSWFERYKWLIWHCASHFTKQFCFSNVRKMAVNHLLRNEIEQS